MISIFNVENWETKQSREAVPVEAVPVEAKAAPTPAPAISLHDFAAQIIGLQNNVTRAYLIAAISKEYNVPDIRATDGLKKMVDLQIIDELHLKDRFMLNTKGNTPF